MDFESGLHKGEKGTDVIWVIVDRLTKSALFLSVKMMDSVDKLTRIYVNEVVRLHRMLSSPLAFHRAYNMSWEQG
jgi:hypothetical protein